MILTLGLLLKVRKCYNKEPIVKLGSIAHNSFEYWTYISSPCPWAIIPIRVTCNWWNLEIILLHIWTLGRIFFVLSILSWIMQRNSTFDQTNFVLHVWYKFLHNFWCKTYFFSFTSYSITLLLCFPNLGIKSLRDSQIVHFEKIDLHFCTSTFKWCLFLSQLLANCKIPPMGKNKLHCPFSHVTKQTSNISYYGNVF